MNFSLPVVLDVSYGSSHVEIPIRVCALFVAKAKTVRAVPEEPPPPTVDFRASPGATLFPAQRSAVLVFYVLISAAGARILNEKRKNYQVSNERHRVDESHISAKQLSNFVFVGNKTVDESQIRAKLSAVDFLYLSTDESK